MTFKPILVGAVVALSWAMSCHAVMLRVAGDVQSMDPHSLNETLRLSFTGSIYEPLVGRAKDMSLTPALATKWTKTSPTVWRFELRKGVSFHDGTPFKNPFKDKRVRQAFYQAIDIESIKARVMRNASTPTGEMVAPGIRGFQPDLNKRLPHDPEAAKKLLGEAGYPNGFEVGMNCPNDRYVNDGQICQAVAASLARIGVKVNLQTETKVSYFPKILRRDTSFYLLGWTPSTNDAHDAMYNLMATPTDKGQGQFNLGSYSNPKFDELALKVQTETDDKRRNDFIREAFKLHQDDIGHIPLHQQALAWGFANKVSLVQLPDNRMFFKWIAVNGAW